MTGGMSGTNPGGSGGSAPSNGGTIPIGGLGGIGAFAGNMIVDPPATVDLEVCESIVDDGSEESRIACFDCCTDHYFVNSQHFAGTCACAAAVDEIGASICAAEEAVDPCFACCHDSNYSGGSFDPNRSGSCFCHSKQDPNVCASVAADSMQRNACAVCCINAGYVSSYIGDNACICADG